MGEAGKGLLTPYAHVVQYFVTPEEILSLDLYSKAFLPDSVGPKTAVETFAKMTEVSFGHSETDLFVK